MANPGYLRSSDGNNADNGSTWALANADLAGAIADSAAGDRIWVSDSHAESTAGALSFAFTGTGASPNQVLCGDDAAEPPTALAATGTVTTTGNNSITLTSGLAEFYGLSFIAGSGASGTANINFGNSGATYRFILDRCKLTLASTGTGSSIVVTLGAGAYCEWRDVTLKFAATAQTIGVRHSLRWYGGSVDSAGTAPTTLFNAGNVSGFVDIKVVGVDLSHLGSGKSLLAVSAAASGLVEFINCKLGASVAVTTGTHSAPGFKVRLVNCDSADTNYRYALHTYQGVVTHEATIVRTGGASDGTTPVSRKMVSSANSEFYTPLEADPVVVWNETTGSSVTATVEVVTDGVTLTDAECWLEAEYSGTSGFPLSLTASDRAADVLATPANQTSSSETWTTTGLGSPVKQALAVSFTPQEKGVVKLKVCLAKASTTVYCCPKATLS